MYLAAGVSPSRSGTAPRGKTKGPMVSSSGASTRARPMIRFLPCGDTALTVELGDKVDRRVSDLVLALAGRVRAASIAGIAELVPTFRSLLIHYDPLTVCQAELKERLVPLLSGLTAARSAGKLW